MNSNICPKCGAKNNPSFDRCWECKSELSKSNAPLPTPNVKKIIGGLAIVIIFLALMLLLLLSPGGSYLVIGGLREVSGYVQHPKSLRLPFLVDQYQKAQNGGDMKKKAEIAYEMATIYYEKGEYQYAATMLSENNLSLLDEPKRLRALEMCDKLGLNDPNSRLSQIIGMIKRLQ